MVLDGRSFHEEGVEAVLLPDAVNAFRVATCIHARLSRLHEGVQLLVGGNGGALINKIALCYLHVVIYLIMLSSRK